MADNRGNSNYDNERLLRALAEQLKLPLMHISQHVELVRMGETADLSHIETITDMALRLVDGFVLSSQIAEGQLDLEFEPVSISSVLQNAAEELDKIAHEYNCMIELQLEGKYGPVMADRHSLETAITTLGYSFIEAQNQNKIKKPRLVLAAHRNRHGIVAGAYGDNSELTSDMFTRAKVLYGKARQSLPPLGHMPSAGIFVADSLFSAMSSKLKVTRHSNLTGLAATLLPNPQLKLVGV